MVFHSRFPHGICWGKTYDAAESFVKKPEHRLKYRLIFSGVYMNIQMGYAYACCNHPSCLELSLKLHTSSPHVFYRHVYIMFWWVSSLSKVEQMYTVYFGKLWICIIAHQWFARMFKLGAIFHFNQCNFIWSTVNSTISHLITMKL